MAFVPRGLFLPLVILVTAILVSFYITGSDGQRYRQVKRYRAAIVQYGPESPRRRTINREQALHIMIRNINNYNKYIKTFMEDKSNDKIIVFPEYGLFGIFGYGTRRSDIYQFLETIPDPRKAGWNPCEKSGYGHEIQKKLSCMAKYNSIYVVANVGEKVECKKTNCSCPKDGRYQYNTNVVYSSDGTLVAKYRKKHLFNEGYYDSPAKTEIVTFKTHFGNFGLMTSHDSLFKSPILDIVNEGIRDIVMPSAWTNSLPLFRAIQWHSSFAQGLQLNLMVSTVYDRANKSYGSGIYGPDGVETYISDPWESSDEVKESSLRSLSSSKMEKDIPFIRLRTASQTQNRYMTFLDQKVIFKFSDKLSKRSDIINICHDRFCCFLNYTFESVPESYGKYALAVYKGPVRTLGHFLEVEVCAVVGCSPKCDQPIESEGSYFSNFNLVGVNFSTSYIFPQVLALNDREAVLPSTDKWVYKHHQIKFDDLRYPLHSASLIGRVYNKDRIDRRASPAQTGCRSFAPAQYVSSLILLVAFIASIMFSS